MTRKTKIQKPVGTVLLMMGATLLAKVLGMLRSVLMASHYGTGMEANAFSQASHIPLTFFDLLFSAAIVGCFIPVYNSFREDDRSGKSEFACIFLNAVLLLTAFFSVLGILFAKPIIALMAPGFDRETAALAVRLLRIMFPMILFTGSTYTLVGIMQSHGKYLLPAMISAVSNAAIILYFLLLDGRFGENSIYFLAVAYLAAWSLQLITLAVPLLRDGFRLRAVLHLRNPKFRDAMRMLPPIMVGSWLSPLGILIGLSVSSLTAVPGAVTIFDYANTVYVIIAGTLSYSICNYIFPKLSRMDGLGDAKAFTETVRTTLEAALMVLLPFAVGAIILSGEGISILYQRNMFDAADAAYTAHALQWLLLAVPAFSVVELLSRVFYARKTVWVPMAAAVTGVFANLVTAILLIRIPALGVGAVAIANAVGQYAAALVLLIALRVKIPAVYDRSLGMFLLKLLIAALLSGAVMLGIRLVIGGDSYTVGFLRNCLTAVLVFLPGIGVYLGAAKLLHLDAVLSSAKDRR